MDGRMDNILDFAPINLEICFKPPLRDYKKMLIGHFDYLGIEVSFMEQSYPRET